MNNPIEIRWGPIQSDMADKMQICMNLYRAQGGKPHMTRNHNYCMFQEDMTSNYPPNLHLKRWNMCQVDMENSKWKQADLKMSQKDKESTLKHS